MSACGYEWADGWSPEHVCHKQEGHDGDHLCKCDGRISRWMADHAPGGLMEDEEEARQRLRRELEAEQNESRG